MSEVGLEPRRSLRRSALEQRQSSSQSPSLKSTSVNGKKRSVDGDDAPVLDSSYSVKEEELDDEEEDSGGPPPLKKVARTSAGGGTILWKTATGAPKQLAFKKVGGSLSNGSNGKSTTAPAAPTNLATALAGLLPQPTMTSPSLSAINPKRLIIKPPVVMPRLTAAPSSPSTSHIVRRRVEKVNNEVCNDCVKALPTLRRSLGRLETRMEAVTSMIKQIVNKHSQQNVAFARPSSSLVPRGQSAINTSSLSPLNGNRAPGNPTAMRFVPISGRNTTSAGMKKFVSEKSGRLSPSSLMYRMISRGLLTYRSPSLTIEEYYSQAPTVIRAHTLKQVQQVMADLVSNGLYKKSDSTVDTMDPECIFEKEQGQSSLNRLSDYGVNSVDFLSGCFDD
ncbi:hypothetical protein PMAYCL1PPCAC_12739 [Pristionchus mayeri]|uniref:Uncharacterized protein n=1 Tax=Pristionchus mayeri TaxID=1317129 RepID=A0AAN5CG80_9BILA|nr:hypothetical protein PMAYCL1PPCAC_12739 [Pristionchus mayeri]